MTVRNAFVLGSLVLSLSACSEEQTPEELDIPVDPDTGLRIPSLPPLPPVPEWEDNPVTDAKKRLGQTLFFDARLSGSERATCANCHLPLGWFQSSTPLDVPDRSYPMLGPSLHRNAPSLLNVIYAPMMRWDGSHFTDLYDVMVLPFGEANMNLSGLSTEAGEEVDVPGARAVLYERLSAEIPGYVDAFEEAFGVDIRELDELEVWRLAGMAMAAYMTVATTHGAPFDAWNQGDDDAIDDAAKRGAFLFAGKAKCIACHSGPLLSDFAFHNVSTSVPDANGNRADEGRYLVTGNEADRGAFLTPMLRGSSKTSPYFHTGITTGIRQVIEQKTGASATADPNHDPVVTTVPELTDQEVSDIVEFIKALEGTPIEYTWLDLPASFPE